MAELMGNSTLKGPIRERMQREQSEKLEMWSISVDKARKNL